VVSAELPTQVAKSEAEVAAPDAKGRLRTRNVAIAWGLVLLIVLFYLITVFKMGGNVLKRTL
jgi:hypothetical protein